MTKHIKRTQHTIFIDHDEMVYELVRSKKRKRSIALKIREDNAIQINCPYHMPLDVVESFIASKIHWIQKNLKTRSDRPNTPTLMYINGEQHLFKGQSFVLQLMHGRTNEVMLKEDQLYIFHRRGADIKKILRTWYRQQALNQLSARTRTLAEQFQLPVIKDIKVRYMKARWGSCSSDAVITYNIHLIKAHDDLIDYVIMHELCHLIHHNHSPRFYQLQSQINPNWKIHKQKLDQLSIMY